MTVFPLRTRGLVRRFPGGAGLDGVDVSVAPGEIHALVGLNGAGKSTLMRLATGMLAPQAGDVQVLGQPVARAPSWVWARVGHLVEQPFAYPELTARSNLLIAARLHGLSRAAAAAAVDEVLTELDLLGYADVRSRRLSLGNRQRVDLAAAVQHAPDLLVLDEPTNALDPAGVIVLRELLLRRAATGCAVLVSSHHLDEVARVAGRITVINAGRVIGTLDPLGVDIERAFFALVHEDDRRTVG